MQKYYRKVHKFNGVFSENNSPKTKDAAHM